MTDWRTCEACGAAKFASAFTADSDTCKECTWNARQKAWDALLDSLEDRWYLFRELKPLANLGKLELHGRLQQAEDDGRIRIDRKSRPRRYRRRT